MSKEIELKIKVTVPDKAKFIATDANGDVCWCEFRPEKGKWTWNVESGKGGFIMTLEHTYSDWEDSLIELGEK